jgi:predicted dehydrogenase
MIEQEICKVAFIGAGYMTSEHLKAFQGLPNVKLSGISSRTIGRSKTLAQSYDIKNVCESIGQLYETTQANLVVISVPELSLFNVCKEAFKYPWVCLIEKPVGYNLQDAQNIQDMAITEGRQVFVALNRRHYSSTKALTDDMSHQEGVRLIHVYDQEDQAAALKAGQPKLVVQNWMFANSIHLIDYFNFLGRGVIACVDPIIPWTPDNPGIVMSKITYSSGDVGIYEAAWNRPGPWAVTVSSEQKRWELRPLEQATFQNYGSRTLELVPIKRWDSEFKPGLRVQAQEAIKAVFGQAHKLPSLAEAMQSMQLVHAIYYPGVEND